MTPIQNKTTHLRVITVVLSVTVAPQEKVASLPVGEGTRVTGD